ncbi:MAG: ATPase [Comamonadaceae bacterium]|nr:MAG: ATPase [Comamonadaceae bacterium]
MTARRIALLGAESTGKSQLAHALADSLQRRGLRTAVVPEVLREWCGREGRAPRPEEQLPIAREQERRVDAAAATHDVVIADTTALMVAIYGALLYADDPLHLFALERQRRYDATLVTGLDLPWVADGLHREGPHAREPVDRLVRDALQRARVDYQVVYGSGPQRVAGALAALDRLGIVAADAHAAADVPTARGDGGKPWVWNCDKCSDPACEHRLFSRLR